MMQQRKIVNMPTGILFSLAAKTAWKKFKLEQTDEQTDAVSFE